VLTHKIAGIIFRTCSNAWIPSLRQDLLDQFLIGDVAPDVRHFVRQVGSDSATLSRLGRKEQEMLLRWDRISVDWLNDSVLKYPEVHSRLFDVVDRPEEIKVWIDKNYVYICDFKCNRLDLFYTEEFGGYVKEQHKYMPEYYVASNFRQMFSSFLSQFSAILLHGAGLIRRNRAVLFLAPDEGGKTTVVKQSNGEPVLSDDQLILRKKGDDIIAHGTPFGAMTSGPCQATLGAIFVLEKASYFQLEPISPSNLIHCLWTAHRNYTFFLPQRLKKYAFQTLIDICHQVPVYMMQFPKDYVDWDAIDAAME